jgi:hypothetical protein
MALEQQHSFKAPPGTCDCHFQGFGDPARYPLMQEDGLTTL